MDKIIQLQNLLEEIHPPKLLSEYILGEFDRYNYAYFDWFVFQKKFFEIDFEYDNEYFLRTIYVLFKGNSYYHYFSHFEKIFTTKEDFKKMFLILKKSGVDLFEAVTFYIEMFYDKEPTNIDILFDLIYPKYDIRLKHILSTMKTNKIKNCYYKIAKKLLEKDFNMYFSEIIGIINKSFEDYYSPKNDFINLIKDENIIKEIILKNLSKLVQSYAGNIQFTQKVINFLESTKNNSDLYEELKILISSNYKYSNFRYYYFLKYIDGLQIDFGKKFHINLIKFGLLLDKTKTMNLITKSYSDYKEIIKILEIDLKEFLIIVASSFFSYQSITEIPVIKQILNENYDETIKVFTEITINDYKYLLKALIEYDKSKIKTLLNKIAYSKFDSEVKKILLFYFKENGTLDDFKYLFASKQKYAREIAVEAAIKMNSTESEAFLNEILQKEKDESLKYIITTFLNLKNSPNSNLSFEDLNNKFEFIKEANSLKGGNYKMIDVKLLSKIKWKDDEKEFSDKEMQLILKMIEDGKTEILNNLKPILDKESCIAFAEDVYAKWNREAKTVWLLKVIPLFANDNIIEPLKREIIELVDNKRGAVASQMVIFIALIGSKKALKVINGMLYKVKQKQIKVAAEESLKEASKNLNLSLEDFLDKLIDDYGFNESGNIELDFGERKFYLSVSPEIDLVIKDETGKIIKSLPKPSKTDDEQKAIIAIDFFKTFKKEIKDESKIQLQRLELNFSSNRLWNKKGWVELFTNNAVMKQFAIGLIWGVYENGLLKSTFRFQEDGSFADINDDTFTIPENVSIGVIHPFDLSESDLNLWKSQLFDYEIKQPFNQLNREIFRVDETNKTIVSCNKFEGYMIPKYSLKTKLTNKGWKTGYTEYNFFDYYFKDLPNYDICVILNFLGDKHSNFNDFSEVPLYDLIFCKLSTTERDYSGKITKKIELKLEDVPERLFSEICYEISVIINTGSGFNENYKEIKKEK